MAKILHILTKEPSEFQNSLIQDHSVDSGAEVETVSLHQNELDYKKLLNDIFEAELVIVW